MRFTLFSPSHLNSSLVNPQQRDGNVYFTPVGLKSAAQKLEDKTGVTYSYLTGKNDEFYQTANQYVYQTEDLRKLMFPKGSTLPMWSEDHLAPLVFIRQGLRRLLGLHPAFDTKSRPKLDEALKTTVLFPDVVKTRHDMMQGLHINTQYQFEAAVPHSPDARVKGSVVGDYYPFQEKKKKLPLEISYHLGANLKEQESNKRVAGVFLQELLQHQGLKEGETKDFVFKQMPNSKR
jgi:hypothetical protein